MALDNALLIFVLIITGIQLRVPGVTILRIIARLSCCTNTPVSAWQATKAMVVGYEEEAEEKDLGQHRNILLDDGAINN